MTCILGDIGLGKSTILRYLSAEYDAREDTVTTFIPTPSFPSSFAMLKSICQDFGLEAMRSREAQKRLFEQYLGEQFINEEKNVVVFIDEAQMISNQQLELLREILNFETNTEKLVQIVVAGQMELKLKINRQQNRPFKSRIMSYSNLNPLTLNETKEMVDHRCRYAEIANPFSDAAIERIYYHTQGVPRSVLKICRDLYELQKLGVAEFTKELIDETAGEAAL